MAPRWFTRRFERAPAARSRLSLSVRTGAARRGGGDRLRDDRASTRAATTSSASPPCTIRGARILTSQRFHAIVKPQAPHEAGRDQGASACARPTSPRRGRSPRCCPTCCASSAAGRWSAITSTSTWRCSTRHVRRWLGIRAAQPRASRFRRSITSANTATRRREPRSISASPRSSPT